jgi:hypothetical protein
MYSASVSGREVFAFAILSSHDVFVAFQSVLSQGFVAARTRQAPAFLLWHTGSDLGTWGIRKLVQQPPDKQRLPSIMVHKRDSEKPRLALMRAYQLSSVFYFADKR